MNISNAAGEMHRYLASGLYWRGRDLRVLGPCPAIGTWEPVSAPDEPASDAWSAELLHVQNPNMAGPNEGVSQIDT